MAPPAVRVEADGSVRFGDRFSVSFQRTLRVPEGVGPGLLPPALGPLPVLSVGDYADRVPAAWRERGGVFVPLHPREALWLAFDAPEWHPHAVKVGVGRVNALTGGPWSASPSADPQDYLVCPPQLWLDGIRTAAGEVRQLVAAPLGRGVTVEGQVTGEESGGLQLLVLPPRPGRFPDHPPPEPAPGDLPMGMGMGMGGPPPQASASAAPEAEMGIAAGGRIGQKVYPDPYGADTWDPDAAATLWVHLLNAELFQAVTGRPPPPSPVSARTYTEHGLPWFELADEGADDLGGSELDRVRPLSELEREAGEDGGDQALEIPEGQVIRLRPGERDGGR
ncbi:MAG TPA: hypothetical protein VEQ60_14015 [Longimicrobium sp.]|nr:hypothetical protein [Longimicrobium sp.]